jgi:hypothetical protein
MFFKSILRQHKKNRGQGQYQTGRLRPDRSPEKALDPSWSWVVFEMHLFLG